MSSPGLHTTIANYQLLEHIGSGGMGDVYKAWHPTLQRYAAVKILRHPDLAERFHNEARIQGSIRHPHIVQLLEFHLSGAQPCIIMEYAEGESLDQYRARKGRLSSEETIAIIRQVADALSYLHKRNLLHRDIKPANFKITAAGFVKMLDFGIARDVLAPRLTQQGFVVGTTDYMAPEQFRQAPEQKSDCWSLGIMTYELLSGFLPFEARNIIALQQKIQRGQYMPVDTLVPGVAPVLRLMIAQTLKLNVQQRLGAAGIVKLLQKESQTEGKVRASYFDSLSLLPRLVKQKWLGHSGSAIQKKIMIGGLLLILALTILNKSRSDQYVTDPAHSRLAADTAAVETEPLNTRHTTISVANAPNAYIIMEDGSRHPLPFRVSGVEGERIRFTIYADGYRAEKLSFDLSPRRSTYDYTLEKIN